MFRLLRFVAGAAIAATLLSVPFLSSRVGAGANTVSVIVELRDDPGAVYAAKASQQGAVVSDDQMQAYRKGLAAAQDKFLADLSSKTAFQLQSVTVGNVKIDMRYTLVYDGVAVKVPASAIPAIKAMPQVKGVHPNTRFFTTLDKSVPYIHAPEVYGQYPELTQFDTFNEGYEGQGIYISVIDTGIDFTHPMFGGDPTPPRLGVAPPDSATVHTNQKVVYSLPLTDLGVEDGFGHGTHVASTAAGYLAKAPGPDGIPLTADDVSIHGVAPQAKLMSYKVCSDVQSTLHSVEPAVPVGGCDTSNIIMAIEDSVSPFTVTGFAKPKAHIINMSLGGGGGPNEATAVASDNASKLGTTVVAAAGNSGPSEDTLGAPAAGSRVIAVAANTDPGSHLNYSVDLLDSSAFPQSQTGAVTPAGSFQAQAGFDRVKLYAQAGTPMPALAGMAQYYALVDFPIVAWPASVSGRIALIKDSGLASGTFFDICTQAANAGAVGMLLSSETTNPTAVKCSIPAANILPDAAQKLIDAMATSGTPENGTLSQFPIRINPDWRFPFVGDTTDFSSRGPVEGYGQVKPDVSAPGANILAAMPPASLLGVLSQSNYGAISGTSMATPHTAGAAALIKQAHLGWTPDMIRTALINTATNMTDEANQAKADGPGSDSINDQGGGLINVKLAINTKGLMGVAGDGNTLPSILGSHSYGAIPVVNSRVTHTVPVTVTIKDVSGQGGTYNLSVANNRDLEKAGVSSTLSDTSVSVPANGTATFTVTTSVDGNVIRDPHVVDAIANGNSVSFVTRQMQMQWYVTATRSGSGEKLRMPFYLRPTPSLPINPIVSPQNIAGILPASSGGVTSVEDPLSGDKVADVPPGASYIDHSFPVSAATYRIQARLDYTAQNVEGQSAEDLDFYLYGPDGKEVAHSAIAGGPEQFDTIVSAPGTYKYRVVGYANGPVQYTITASLSAGPPAPTMQAVASEFVNAAGDHVDFDGSYNVQWTPQGGEQGFELEQSTDNQNWEFVGSVGAGTTSYAVTNAGEGDHYYRVRGITTGQIGKYITVASDATKVVVSGRTQVDITSLISYPYSQISLVGGVFQFDVSLVNNQTQTYLPMVDFNVIGCSPAGVKVINADNSKDGTSLANAALFGFSQKLGSDQQFTQGEATATRTIRLQDSAMALASVDVLVTAYVGTGGSSSSSSSSQSGAPAPPAGGGAPGNVLSLSKITAVMRFTVNPLTKTVTTQLIRLK